MTMSQISCLVWVLSDRHRHRQLSLSQATTSSTLNLVGSKIDDSNIHSWFYDVGNW